MNQLSLKKIVLYSAGILGANMAYAFANLALPLYLASYHLPNLLIGFFAQERSLIAAFALPVVGAVSDRLPQNRLGRRRPFIMLGAPLTAAALILLATRPPLWIVIALITAFAVCLSIAYNPYLALMPDITPSSQRGRVGGVMAVFTVLGIALASAVSYLFWEQNQPLVFWLIGIGVVAGFAVTFFSIREPGVVHPVARREMRVRALELFRRRELFMFMCATFAFWLGNGGITPFATRYAVEVLGVSESTAFLVMLPAVIGAVIFAVPAGILTEKFGKKRVLAAGMVLFGLCALLGGPLLQTVPQAAVVMFLSGVANAITTALIFPLLTDLIPAHRAGEFIGLGALVWSISQPIGALAAGAVGDVTGSLRWAFALGGLAMVVAAAILMFVREPTVAESEPTPTALPMML